MKRSILILMLVIIGAIVISGCLNTTNPVDPNVDEPTPSTGMSTFIDQQPESGNFHYLYSFQFIFIDQSETETPVFEVLASRQISAHWNILSWLETGPCTNCFRIAGITPSGTGTLLIDIEITHPFSNPYTTGFDVRGIPMFDANGEFPESGLTWSDSSLGDGALVNPDGYTTLYNSTTYGSGPNGMEGYIKGKLGTETFPDALLNGYMRHNSIDPGNTRNAFFSGDVVTVTYEMSIPSGPFFFGYAVDASWAAPTVNPVTDPITQFPPEANCPEAWKIEITENPINGGLMDCGGSTELVIDIYDWQGEDEFYMPVVECSELCPPPEVTLVENYSGFTRYSAIISNDNLAPAGTYECLISKQAEENDPVGKPWLDLSAYQVVELEVLVETDNPPTAIAVVAKTDLNAYEIVDFIGLLSHDNDCTVLPIVKYEWDWENDGIYDEEGPNWHHWWTEEGTYYVQLRVTDDEGSTDTLDEPIEITVSEEFIVEFMDENLEAKVREAIGIPTAPIWNTDLIGFTELIADNSEISDLHGLNHCIDLIGVDLSGNELDEIGPMATLHNLTWVYLHDNEVDDVAPLNWNILITQLTLQNNDIDDVSPLSNLTALTHLNLSDNPGITDIGPLTTLVNMLEIELSNLNITTIGPLSYLKKLIKVSFDGNNVSMIGPLMGLSDLTFIQADHNVISNLGPLNQLGNIQQLSLGYNAITDIGPVSGCANLEKIVLTGNYISDIHPLADIPGLVEIQAGVNLITDISHLSGLTNLDTVILDSNFISDLGPLTENTGLGTGDYLDVTVNPLSDESINTYIPALEAAGVTVVWE